MTAYMAKRLHRPNRISILRTVSKVDEHFSMGKPPKDNAPDPAALMGLKSFHTTGFVPHPRLGQNEMR